MPLSFPLTFPLDLATFRALKQEFAKVSDDKVNAALYAAQLRTDQRIFAAYAPEAHMWLTAHLLAADPRGNPARIKGEAERTVYLAERERLEDLVGAAQIAAAELGG